MVIWFCYSRTHWDIFSGQTFGGLSQASSNILDSSVPFVHLCVKNAFKLSLLTAFFSNLLSLRLRLCMGVSVVVGIEGPSSVSSSDCICFSWVTTPSPGLLVFVAVAADGSTMLSAHVSLYVGVWSPYQFCCHASSCLSPWVPLLPP